MAAENTAIIPVSNNEAQQQTQMQAVGLPVEAQRQLLRQAYSQAFDRGDIKRLYLAVELYGQLVDPECPCCFAWDIETPTMRLRLAARILEPQDIKAEYEPFLEITEQVGPRWRPRIVCSDKIAHNKRWIDGDWLQLIAQEAQRLEVQRRAEQAKAAAERTHQVQVIQLAEELSLARDLLQS